MNHPQKIPTFPQRLEFSAQDSGMTQDRNIATNHKERMLECPRTETYLSETDELDGTLSMFSPHPSGGGLICFNLHKQFRWDN